MDIVNNKRSYLIFSQKIFAIRQDFLIGHINGLLWLRRYPSSIIFTALIPFSFLFIVFIIGGGQYTNLAFAGSLLSASVGYGLATGNNIITWKEEYKMQDFFVSSPVSSTTYMIGIALAELLFGLPAFVILGALIVIFSSNFLFSIVMVGAVLVLMWGWTSSVGYFISTRSRHRRFVESFIAFLRIAIVVLPPVFYPLSVIQNEFLHYLAYAIPTTHASLLLQYAMGVSQPTGDGWLPEIGFGVIGIYILVFILLAKTKAMWREN